MKKLIPLIITGPSGCGKSTLVKALLQNYRNYFGLSVSYTTRPSRDNEIDGIDYFFKTKEEFEKCLKEDFCIEHELINDHYYGTPKMELERIQKMGLIPLLDIDIKGAMTIHNGKKLEQANYLFVYTKDLNILRKRLEDRNTETAESIEKRLKRAPEEIELAKNSGFYPEENYILNDELDKTLRKFYKKVHRLYDHIDRTIDF